MRKYLIAAALATVLMMVPAVSAGGANGGWGKGLLSTVSEFYVGDAEDPSGYMYWNPEAEDFIYDFHGYYLDVGTVYYLIAFEGDPAEAPDEYTLLGAKEACDLYGVHIKGAVEWPGLTLATVCLVPDTYIGFGGGDDWMPETYQMAEPVNLLG